MENKKSSEKISDILEEIEAVVEEEKKASSPLGDDQIDEESQDNIENQHSESVETIEVISTINRKIGLSIFPGKQPRHVHQEYRGEYEASPSGNETSHCRN